MPRSALVIVVGALAQLLAGCHSSTQHPDVSAIPMKVDVSRFDREFAGLDTLDITASLDTLAGRYPAFLPVYLTDIMNFGTYPDTSVRFSAEISAFLNGRDIRLLNDTVQAHFPDMDLVEEGLREGFRYIKYYFPAFRPPRVVTFISGLANYGAVTVDSVLGIGLDMFLGEDFRPYRQVADPYPGYMLHRFSPPYIVADCLKVLEQQLFPLPRGGTLLDEMIAYGKQLYFLDQVMPRGPDTLKIGYTRQQLAWCEDNEEFIWQYLVQNDLLYIGDQQRILHYIGPGPSTQGMPAAAPGDIGSWVGWQIVRKYMKDHPATTLDGLMKGPGGQQLLSLAGYHPH